MWEAGFLDCCNNGRARLSAEVLERWENDFMRAEELGIGIGGTDEEGKVCLLIRVLMRKSTRCSYSNMSQSHNIGTRTAGHMLLFVDPALWLALPLPSSTSSFAGLMGQAEEQDPCVLCPQNFHVGRLIVTWPKSRAVLRLVGAGHAPFNPSPETCLGSGSFGWKCGNRGSAGPWPRNK